MLLDGKGAKLLLGQSGRSPSQELLMIAARVTLPGSSYPSQQLTDSFTESQVAVLLRLHS